MRQNESYRGWRKVQGETDLGIGALNVKLPILSYWYIVCAILI